MDQTIFRQNREEGTAEAEIYVHIPFCVKKCDYCDFLSFPAGEEERERYVDALLHEIAASSAELQGRQIRSVFFGGGTPTVLRAGQIIRILEMILRCTQVKKDAEITIECNPGTAESEELKDLRKAGFCRLSIGAQSFDDRQLKRIGRIHRRDDIIRCCGDARAAGFDNINLDLISALPEQTEDEWIRTLREAAALEPEHLSAYSLILEEGTPLFENAGSYTFPEEEAERSMYYRTAEILSEYGFRQYEISNYARPGKECIHNIGYWTGVEYKGFGLGASSLIGRTRFKNTEWMEEYLQYAGTPEKQYKEIQILSEEDRRSEFMILGLRMTEGISLKEFEKKFRGAVEMFYPGVVDKYTASGLLKTENGRLMFTRDGVSVSNVVLAEFV